MSARVSRLAADAPARRPLRGRLHRPTPAVLPEATRLIVLKSDGSLLVHDDTGGCKPLNSKLALEPPVF